MTGLGSLILAIISIALIKATPLAFAGLGGVISENAGVINISLEGMMVGGAFTAVLVSYYTDNLFFAVVGAVGAGALMAALLAYFAITLRADQFIVGMALNVLGIGGAAYLLSAIFGQPGASPQVRSFSSLGNPQAHALFWLAVILVIALHVFLYRTRTGLHLRAVGEEPRAAATAGIDVVKYRYAATIAGGALCLLYTSPSPRDLSTSRMPSSA